MIVFMTSQLYVDYNRSCYVMLVFLSIYILNLLEINENIIICRLSKQLKFISSFLKCQVHITEQGHRLSHTCDSQYWV